MFEIAEISQIIQLGSLAVALASAIAAVIYFLRKPREEHQQTITKPKLLASQPPNAPEPVEAIVVYLPRSYIFRLLELSEAHLETHNKTGTKIEEPEQNRKLIRRLGDKN